MRLYNANLSPFASRCRIAIYAKGLDVELAPPPDGLSSDAYRAINPTGKVPALVDGDFVLPESETICEYLEDRYPEPSLGSPDPVLRARIRLLSRLADLYIIPPMATLFDQVAPAARDFALIAERLAELEPAFDHVEHFIAGGPFAVGDRLSLADCTLFPVYFFATRVIPLVGGDDILVDRPKTAAWWKGIFAHPSVARVDGEMQAALAEFMAQH
jgi:glutathione S-transferase